MINRPNQQRKGYVLIAVLLVIFVLSYASYRYVDAMTAEYAAAVKSTEAVQVKSYAISGVHYAMATLSDPNYQSVLLGNTSNNPSLFQNGIAGSGEGPRGGGRFSLINITGDGSSSQPTMAYGVIDESSKININALIQQDPTGQVLYNALMKLPGMTEEIADAIVDWVDVDDTPRTAGAESGDYQNYKPKNGPIATLGELLFVRGVTPQLLYGSDTNGNGVIDADEVQGDSMYGWSQYLTAYGREANVDSTGSQRIDLTSNELSTLYEELLANVPQEMADYITAYRIFTQSAAGSTTSSTTITQTTTQVNGREVTTVTRAVAVAAAANATPEQVQAAVQLALTTGIATSKNKIRSILDLVNTQITLPRAPGSPPNSPQLVYPSPLNNPDKLKQYLPILLDKTAATPATELSPRININTAPYEVLLAVPGMTEDMASNIVSNRTAQDPTDLATTTGAWLVTQLNMPGTTYRSMSAYVTGRTQVYRVQSLGYFANGGPTARVEAVIDTNQGHPRIVSFRDLTELGRAITPPR